MLEVVRCGVGYTTATQNLGKSDKIYKLMQPRTPTFLITLDSKQEKTPLPG